MNESRLTAVRPETPGLNERWVYICACGTERAYQRRSVQSGKVKSCGCLSAEIRATRNRRHGLAARGKKPPEYWVWMEMKKRCSNPKNAGYPNYGGRGISVCSRWRESFEAFISDMGWRPAAGLQIDRIDNDGNYEPANCRWTTRSENCRNRRPRRR